jgi:hypothetical protein
MAGGNSDRALGASDRAENVRLHSGKKRKGGLAGRPRIDHKYLHLMNFYFFVDFFLLPKLVSTLPPIEASICLAASA